MTNKLITYINRYKLQFTGALLLAAGTILAGMGLMSTSGYLISRAAERPLIVDLFMVTAAVRFFGISRAVVRYFERVVSHDLTFKILLSMRSQLYRQIDAFSQKWFMNQRPGELLSGVTSDIETLQNVYLRIISPVIVAVTISLSTVLALTYFDVRLAIYVLFFFLANGLAVPYLALQLARGRGKKDAENRTNLKVFLVDQLQGLQDLIWMGQKRNTRKKFDEMQRNLDGVQKKNAGTSGLVEGLTSLASNLAMYTTLVLSIPLVISGEIKGVLLAAITLGVLSSFEALQGLANAFIQYENSQEAAKRLFSIAGSEKNQPRPAELITLATGAIPDIFFQNVSFSYDGNRDVLEDITFSLPAGSKTAIVGPTGCGKSTLIHLLLGFWSPDQGKITANSHDIKQLDMERYRSLFGVVSQDTYIFNRSLRENLLLANPSASEPELKESLISVSLKHLASHLDMEPGTQGMRFSGGERQLLAMARALLTNSNFWIFDEPTAHMDANTERKLLNNLWKNLRNRTLLLVTHRLIDMDKMDHIIVMQRGVVAEQGTHQGLLKKNQLYAKMHHQQNQVIRD